MIRYTSQIFEFVVDTGEKTREFNVHRDLLIDNSGFFKKALTGD